MLLAKFKVCSVMLYMSVTICATYLLTLGACARVTVVGLSVCLSVCYHANCYIPRLRVQFAVLQGSLWRSQFMICVDFSENALFTSLGVICRF